MARRKSSKAPKTTTQYYHDPNHDYFSSHFEELVTKHGGKWVVLAKGELIAICEGSEIHHWLDNARSKFPNEIPFASPIPRYEVKVLCRR